MASCLGLGVAHANGRPPLANGLAVDPTEPGRIALRNTFGIALRQQAGGSWTWLCEQAIGFSGVFDPVVSFAPGGTLLASLGLGLVRTADGGCSFQPVAGVDQVKVRAVVWPGEGSPVYLAGEPETGGALFYRSTDGGESFAPGGGVTVNESEDVTSLVVAPGDPQRLYATVWPDYQIVPLDQQAPTRLLVSQDGGKRFDEVTYKPVEGRANLRVLAVAADDPARVFAYAVDVQRVTEGLLVLSTDGGASWTSVSQVGGPVLELLLADATARTLLLATGFPLDRSTDGGKSFSRDGQPHTYCLGRAGASLLACASQLRVGYALGSSDDQGASWTPIMRYEDLQPPSCPEGSPAAQSCTPLFQALRDQIAPGAGPTDGGPPPDGAPADGAPPADGPASEAGGGPGQDTGSGATPDGGAGGGGSGGCVLAGTEGSAPATALLAALALLLVPLLLARRPR